MGPSPRIARVTASVYRIPTEEPESDGTLSWDHTILVLARASAGDHEGIGYTYASGAAARIIEDVLGPTVCGLDAFAIPLAWQRMRRAVRNMGQSGVCFNAISAVDTALWDLKARLLAIPLVSLFGDARESVAVYGSGGFTSYDESQLVEQLGGWAASGFRMVKMKVGRDPNRDLARVRAASRAVAGRARLFVDANGAYDRKVALQFAEEFAAEGVSWFEEPVSSNDLAGLRLLRDRAPAGMQIAAGEYGYMPDYFHRMLEAEAVDVLQADATRCGGFTGFFIAAALTEARSLELSAHCAPSLHVHACCALRHLRHLEYFHDHARIEHILFDGVPEVHDGELAPDRSRPGLGLELKTEDAQRFAAAA